MKFAGTSRFLQINLTQWLALPLSTALGLLLLAGLLFGLAPHGAAAAGPAGGAAAPALNCTLGNLKSAVSAGGTATFTCAVTTTITVDGRLTVTKDLTLDGGGKLIVSGANQFGLFVVQPGVHFTVRHLVLRDANVSNIGANGGAIYNNGLLNVSSSQLLSNTAVGGAAVFNAPSSSAVISGSEVDNNLSGVTVLARDASSSDSIVPSGVLDSAVNAGALLNGDINNPTQTASLTVVNTNFTANRAGFGAAIANLSGATSVTGGTFSFNGADNGGAIYNNDHLTVVGSLFGLNAALPPAPLSQAQAIQRPAGSLNMGGAINAFQDSTNLIVDSSFEFNLSFDAGGAILFGTLPLDSNVSLSPGSLTLIRDSFDTNCTKGAGGAVSSSETASVSDSTFTNNTADLEGCLSLSQRTSALAGAGPNAPASVPSYLGGTGGAIFSDGPLSVDHTNFLSNSATITVTGGGGALSAFADGQYTVTSSSFTANSSARDGGAIFQSFSSTGLVVHDDFTGNSADHDSGGAIANLGALTVTQSSFTANFSGEPQGPLGDGGGAIASQEPMVLAARSNSGSPGKPNGAGQGGRVRRPNIGPANSLYVDHSTFISNHSEYEGGALDAGVTGIVASTFQSNTARFGGALDVLDDNLSISASTFIANAVVTTTDGPARQGGAIDSNGYHISIVNSTFFNNHAAAGAVGGAINGDDGALTMTNSTLISNTAATPGNGGALAANAPFILRNTIIAYSLGASCQETMTLSGPNLEFPGNTCGGVSLLVDPQALAPANNGGPTLTSALLLGSPAINAGDDATCPSIDQRGAHRPVGSHCDLGAYEFGAKVPFLWLALVRK